MPKKKSASRSDTQRLRARFLRLASDPAWLDREHIPGQIRSMAREVGVDHGRTLPRWIREFRAGHFIIGTSRAAQRALGYPREWGQATSPDDELSPELRAEVIATLEGLLARVAAEGGKKGE